MPRRNHLTFLIGALLCAAPVRTAEGWQPQTGSLDVKHSDSALLDQSAPPVVTNRFIRWFQWPQADGGNDHWYGPVEVLLQTLDAEALAQRAGGHLASFGDTNELNFASRVAGLSSSSAIYLTGFSAEPGMPYTWSDGTAVTPEILHALNQPTGTNQNTFTQAIYISSFGRHLLQHAEWQFVHPLIEITNHPATLLPIIKNAPADSEHYSINPATFQVTALGPEPITYHWKIDGHPILGETNSSYTMQFTTGSTGLLSVAVSNPNGTIESVPAKIEIVPVEFSGSLGWAQWRVETGGNGHWYGWWSDVLNPITWPEANDFARSMGSHLIAIQDQDEWDRLMKFLSADFSELPLGLHDTSAEGAFEWSDGSPLNFTLWADNEPGNTDPRADFAYISGERSWRATTNETQFRTVFFERTNSPAQIAPLIRGPQPEPIRLSIGNTNVIKFDVIAGAGSVYEWRVNGDLVSRGVDPTLALNPGNTNATGLYQLIVRNAYGAATSAPVAVTVFEGIRPHLNPVYNFAARKVLLHFNFPPDADRVDLESSPDLIHWLKRDESTSAQPPYFETHLDPGIQGSFYRLRRFP